MTEQDFTHFDESGRARMVNVGDKEITKRTAVAEGRVLLNPHTFELIKSGGMKKAMCWRQPRLPASWAPRGHLT